MAKTNFVIIKSIRKRDMPVNIKIRDKHGTYNTLVRKNHLKYLGVMIDDCESHGNTTFLIFVLESLEILALYLS